MFTQDQALNSLGEYIYKQSRLELHDVLAILAARSQVAWLFVVIDRRKSDRQPASPIILIIDREDGGIYGEYRLKRPDLLKASRLDLELSGHETTRRFRLFSGWYAARRAEVGTQRTLLAWREYGEVARLWWRGDWYHARHLKERAMSLAASGRQLLREDWDTVAVWATPESRIAFRRHVLDRIVGPDHTVRYHVKSLDISRLPGPERTEILAKIIKGESPGMLDVASAWVD